MTFEGRYRGSQISHEVHCMLKCACQDQCPEYPDYRQPHRRRNSFDMVGGGGGAHKEGWGMVSEASPNSWGLGGTVSPPQENF